MEFGDKVRVLPNDRLIRAAEENCGPITGTIRYFDPVLNRWMVRVSVKGMVLDWCLDPKEFVLLTDEGEDGNV